MRAAHLLLRRRALAAAGASEPAVCSRGASHIAAEAAADPAAAGLGPSSAAALAALRQRLQSGPDLGEFVKGSDLADYSVYAPKPKVRSL